MQGFPSSQPIDPHAPHPMIHVGTTVSQPFDGSASQSPKPARHTVPQRPPMHTGVALVGAVQALPQRPQLVIAVLRFTSQPFVVAWSQSSKGSSQTKPHSPVAHVADALGTVAQGAQRAPQELTETSGVQRPSHSC